MKPPASSSSVPPADDILIWTHDGPYHTDDVVACSILLGIYPSASVKRSRSPSDGDFANFAVDVGGCLDPAAGKFDHHGELRGMKRHAEQVPMAATGLVWDHHGEDYVRKMSLKLGRNKRPAIQDIVRWKGLPAAVRERDVIKTVTEMVRKSVILPVDVWDYGTQPIPLKIPGLHFNSIVNSMSQAGVSFNDVLDFSKQMLESVTLSCLVRTARTKAIHTDSHKPLANRLRLPVKPYSWDHVVESCPLDLNEVAVAYYVNGEWVDWVSPRHNQEQDKGCTSIQEFERMF